MKLIAAVYAYFVIAWVINLIQIVFGFTAMTTNVLLFKILGAILGPLSGVSVWF